MDKKIIFWDFDGVIMDSMHVRDQGFIEVLKEFPKEQVDELLVYHKANGGLSRYVKFRYFFEDIRNETIRDEEIQNWANKFSSIMMNLLVDKSLLIKETVDFIKSYYEKKTMHIVSGSDQQELRFLCQELEIAKYFKSIHGSPTPKPKLVEQILDHQGYLKNSCVLIGDSGNDYDAAKANDIAFLAYNNPDLEASHNVFKAQLVW